jgi:hypothetical protein
MAMSTTPWHADASLLAAYVRGHLDAVLGASLERHLEQCPACRANIADVVETPLLDQAWTGIQDRVERPEQPVAIRIARRWGLPEPASVLLAASASLRTAWLSSSLVALAFAFVASRFSDGNRLWPFLLVAPLIPVIGVAASYGPVTDPLESLIVTSPYGRTRLILVRALAVLTTCLPWAVLLGLMLPGPTWVAAAWLGPALAMVPVLLALAAYLGPRPAAGLLAIGWSAVVLGSARHLPATWPVQAEQQLVLLALATTATVVLAVRMRRTHRIGVAL